MNDAIITVIGFVAAEPRYTVTDNGLPLMSLRVGSTPRRFDRDLGQWRDEDPMFLTVNCWRALAENLAACELKRGDPLIVSGRLRIHETHRDGQHRFSALVEATTVGHDLSRGVARFQRPQRSIALPEDRRQADDLADHWLEQEDGEVTAAAAEAGGDSGEPGDARFRAVA